MSLLILMMIVLLFGYLGLVMGLFVRIVRVGLLGNGLSLNAGAAREVMGKVRVGRRGRRGRVVRRRNGVELEIRYRFGKGFWRGMGLIIVGLVRSSLIIILLHAHSNYLFNNLSNNSSTQSYLQSLTKQPQKPPIKIVSHLQYQNLRHLTNIHP